MSNMELCPIIFNAVVRRMQALARPVPDLAVPNLSHDATLMLFILTKFTHGGGGFKVALGRTLMNCHFSMPTTLVCMLLSP